MPVADYDLSAFCAKLKASFNVSSETVVFEDPADLTFLTDLLAEPAHVWVQFYTASAEECVLFYTDAEGEITWSRGREGTTYRSWPTGTCVKIKEAKDGNVVDLDDEDTDSAPGADLVLGKGLVMVDGAIQLDPALASLNYSAGGLVIECGIIRQLPEGGFASLLPAWGCPEKGTADPSDPVSAELVPYEPKTNATVVTATNIQDAVDQVCALLEAIQVQAEDQGYVSSIEVGDCLLIDGSSTNPIISYDTSLWIADGVYNGFTFLNGKITSYTPEGPFIINITGDEPLTVDQDGNQVHITIAEATEAAKGVVCLASYIQYNTPDFDIQNVVTVTFLESFIQNYDWTSVISAIPPEDWQNILPYANTVSPGIIELATVTEALAATSNILAMTPYTTKQLIEACVAAFATVAEAQAKTRNDVVLSPQTGAALVEICRPYANATQAVDTNNTDTVMTPAATKLMVQACIPLATAAQAAAGIDNEAYMTPLRTKEAIEAYVQVATNGQATGGTNNEVFMTPLRTKEAIEACVTPATNSQAVGGTDNEAYMTPFATLQAINEFRPKPSCGTARGTATSLTVPSGYKAIVWASATGFTSAASGQLLVGGSPVDTAPPVADGDRSMATQLTPGSYALAIQSTEATDTITSGLFSYMLMCA